jgi:hypothetical protein
LDPVRLLSDIRHAQARLVQIADQPVVDTPAIAGAATIEEFLTSLRTAWRYGEVRPTLRRKQIKKRERRRPVPFEAVTAELRGWFDAEPWRTGREFFERLQAANPGRFPDGQIRTMQRRLKEWRRERSHAMVFGEISANKPRSPDAHESALSGLDPARSDRG